MAHCTPAQAQHVYSAIIISTYCSGCCEILSLSFHEALIKWITTNPMSFYKTLWRVGFRKVLIKDHTSSLVDDSRYFQSAGGGPRMDVPEVMFPGAQDRAACSTLQRRPQASVLQLDLDLH